MLTDEKTVHRKLHEIAARRRSSSASSRSTRSSSATSTPCTSATARTASRSPPSATSADPRAQLTLAQSATARRRCSRHRRATTRSVIPIAPRHRRNEVLDAMAQLRLATQGRTPRRRTRRRSALAAARDHGQHCARRTSSSRCASGSLANPAFGATEADARPPALPGRLDDHHHARSRTRKRSPKTRVDQVLVDRAHDPAAAARRRSSRATGHVVAYVGGRGYDGPEPWAQFDLAGQVGPPDRLHVQAVRARRARSNSTSRSVACSRRPRR